jgi:hypothetical protein
MDGEQRGAVGCPYRRIGMAGATTVRCAIWQSARGAFAGTDADLGASASAGTSTPSGAGGNARAAGDTRLEARSLQGVADTLERIEGKRNEARAAWAEYLVFANGDVCGTAACSSSSYIGDLSFCCSVEKFTKIYKNLQNPDSAKTEIREKRGEQLPCKGRAGGESDVS